ncbi:MAG: MFS transporter, partial [Acetobacteraceae bacterium]|nr:MFS transporter [Acetobacteraceae bacterium]
TFLLLAKLPEAAFLAWGWRLPFLLSAVLIAVGVFVRLRMVETPAFLRLKRERQVARIPLLEVLAREPRTALVAIGLKLSEVAWVYVLTVFAIVYATGRLHLPRRLILDAILWAALVEFVTLPLFGWLSDLLGRRPIYVAGSLVSAVCAFATFSLLDTRDPTIVVATIVVVMSLTHAMMFGPQAALMPELFATRVRYTGASVGCQVAAALSGGFSPLIASALLAWTGATWPISLYLVGLAALTLLATLAARETRDLDIARR